jgi:type II secretory pathway component PulM
MADFIIKLLDEAKTQPLATVIVLVLLGVGIWWLIWERPKYRKDQQSLTEHVACSNELTRITHAVIENNSRVIANNTQTMEMTKQSLNT